jgi:hypothetical protein
MSRKWRSIDDPQRRSILRPVLILPLAALPLFGCRNNRSDLVEAELRTREAELRQTRAELQRSQGLNGALQQEMMIRTPVAAPAPPFCEPGYGPVGAMSGQIKEIVLARGTGGIDEDGWPGDEALLVVLVPKDVDGSAVKVPGNLTVMAAEITPEGVKMPLSTWEIPSLQLQKMWRSGLLSSGYHVKLPWKKWPGTEKVRVTCHFTTLPDNRLFEADKDVLVHLAPGVPHAAPMTVVPGPPPGPIITEKPAPPEGARLLDPIEK